LFDAVMRHEIPHPNPPHKGEGTRGVEPIKFCVLLMEQTT
jgi:hypothetical protein